MEEPVLLPERFHICPGMGLLDLECHVGIGDLWNWRTIDINQLLDDSL